MHAVIGLSICIFCGSVTENLSGKSHTFLENP